MPKDLVIVGAGGFAREVLWLANTLADQWRVIGFLDDGPLSEVGGYSVLGRIGDASKYSKAWFVVAVGNPRSRRKIVDALHRSSSPKFATLVASGACVGPKVTLGEGIIVTEGCILTTDIILGAHNIINLNCTIGHDVRTGDFCTIAPVAAVSGNVHLGAGVEVGTGAAIKQGVKIGEGAVAGMGSCVVKDIAPDTVVIGNPAKVMKVMDEKWANE